MTTKLRCQAIFTYAWTERGETELTYKRVQCELPAPHGDDHVGIPEVGKEVRWTSTEGKFNDWDDSITVFPGKES